MIISLLSAKGVIMLRTMNDPDYLRLSFMSQIRILIKENK